MMTDTFEADLRQALARRAADVPDATADRLRDANYRPQTRVRPGRLTAVGLAAVRLAAVGLAVALTAGVTVAVLPSHGQSPASRARQNTLGAATAGEGSRPAQLLADRAAAAALAGPEVKPGEWVYRQLMYASPAGPGGKAVESMWFTAAGRPGYADDGAPMELQVFPAIGYAQLGALPADPAALEKYLANAGWRNEFAPGQQVSPEAGNKNASAFDQITAMLWLYTMPSRLTAELYHALADVPGVTVDKHATDLAGRPGVAFVLPPADGYPYRLELVLNGSDDRLTGLQQWFVGRVAGETGIRTIPLAQFALLQTAFVARPGDRPAVQK
jgi:hypothetical protein